MTSREEFVHWVRDDAHELAGTDLDLPGWDLGSLTDIVGDARVVGLGESRHCIREFLGLHYRVVKYLVEHLGFDAILFEGVRSTDSSLDAYVEGQGSEPALPRPRNNLETRQLVDWLRSFNRSAAHRVHVYGADLQDGAHSPGLPVDELAAFLVRADPEHPVPDLEEIRDVLAQFPTGMAAVAHWKELDRDRRNLLRSVIDALASRLVSRSAEYTYRTSREAYEWARHRAAGLLQSLDFYETGMPEREIGMAENTKWALDELGPTSRAILLGHIIHIGRDARSRPGGEPGLSTGDLLSQWYGDGYVATTTTSGFVGELDVPSPTNGSNNLGPGQPDTVDQAMQEARPGTFIVDLRAARGMSWLSEPRGIRVSEGLSWHFDCPFPEAFDTVLHSAGMHTAPLLEQPIE